MTALGKTLVFFNLLFSLVTGGLIVMVFVTRTNWKDGMEKALAETKSSHAEAAAIRAQRDQIAAEAANMKQKYEGMLKAKDVLIVEKEAENANQKQQAEAARKDAAEQLKVTEFQSTQIARLQNERNQKDEYLKLANEQIVKITNDLALMTQQEKYHHLRGDALEKELSGLKETYALTVRKFEELSARARNLPDQGAVPNPPRHPSIDITGRVTQADGNWAVISLGTDNGIEQGHQLDVSRTSPEPLYLGKFTVTKSEPHRAVGLFEPAGKGKTIKVDDTVDSRNQR